MAPSRYPGVGLPGADPSQGLVGFALVITEAGSTLGTVLALNNNQFLASLYHPW